MGSVHAKSPPSAEDFGTTLPPPPPPPPTMEPPMHGGEGGANSSSTKAPLLLDLPANPGSLEDLQKKFKDLMPMLFEGGRIMVNKGLSNHFQISHTINLSNETPKGYRFGATYVGGSSTSAQDATPVLTGDIDPSGDMNAQCISQLTPNLKAKLVTQVKKNKYTHAQLAAEYSGVNFTSTFTAANIDIKTHSGILVGQHLQNVLPRVALGAECVYQYGPQIPGGGLSVMSVVGRYIGDQHIVAGTLSTASATASYYLRTNETTQIGVEVMTNFRMNESIANFAYQLDIPKANIVFRGMIDSNWTVGAVMERKLTPLPFTLCISGMLNHVTAQSQFGLGLNIG